MVGYTKTFCQVQWNNIHVDQGFSTLALWTFGAGSVFVVELFCALKGC